MEINVAKGITIAIFFFIPAVLGPLPFCLVYVCKWKILDPEHRLRSAKTFVNCFVGGFFLGTCLVVLMINGKEQFEDYKSAANTDSLFPTFEVMIGIGFFVVALIEKLVFLLMGYGQKVKDGDSNLYSLKKTSLLNKDFLSQGKSDNSLSTPSSSPGTDEAVEGDVYKNVDDVCGQSTTTTQDKTCKTGLEQTLVKKCTPSCGHPHGDRDHLDVKQKDDTADQEWSGDLSGLSGLRVLLLLLVMAFHTVFDGLAVGLQTEERDVWAVLAPVIVHKAVVSVVLGMELTTVCINQPLRGCLAVSLYAVSAPTGVGIGMYVTSGSMNMRAQLLTGSVLQALATGAFLYVTSLEFLGREMAGRDGRVWKVLAAMLGYGLIVLMQI